MYGQTHYNIVISLQLKQINTFKKRKVIEKKISNTYVWKSTYIQKIERTLQVNKMQTTQ